MYEYEIQKITDALVETKSLLAKELTYQPQFRNNERIAFYNTHITKLENMLSDIWDKVSKAA